MNADGRRSLIVSSGGSRAILGGTGTILACHFAGIAGWQTIGGVSGGSIPAIMLAAGATPAQLVERALTCDFGDLVKFDASPVQKLVAFLLKDFNETQLVQPSVGIMDTEKLGAFIETHVSEWPKNFWTMAVAGDSQIVFRADGVFEYDAAGREHILSTTPMPVGMAIRATCTVPGMIRSLQYQGRYLFDGALSKDGLCPVAVPIRHLGVEPATIVAACLGEEFSAGFLGSLRGLWRILWSVPQEPKWGPEARPVLAVHPKIRHIHALKFQLSLDEKWLAIALGFEAGLKSLAKAGILQGDRLKEGREILTEIGNLQTVTPQPLKAEQDFAHRMQSLFRLRNLC